MEADLNASLQLDEGGFLSTGLPADTLVWRICIYLLRMMAIKRTKHALKASLVTGRVEESFWGGGEFNIFD